jgi:hypothetical protein
VASGELDDVPVIAARLRSGSTESGTAAHDR